MSALLDNSSTPAAPILSALWSFALRLTRALLLIIATRPLLCCWLIWMRVPHDTHSVYYTLRGASHHANAQLVPDPAPFPQGTSWHQDM